MAGIKNHVFYGCKSLTIITIPTGVTSIGYYVFYGCESLKSLIIPDGVAFIGDEAFRNCKSLTSIMIPDSVTSIGEKVCHYCTNLTDVWYTGTVDDRNNIAISGKNTYLNNATWHYETCSDEHTYLNDGDATCEYCEWIRELYTIGDVDGDEGISANDAIYLLYNVFFGDEAYPLT